MLRSFLLSLAAAVLFVSAARGAEPAKPKHTNRLAKETSPYLLLHAHNPVDWHPWGEEALAKAKRENKPIFLSIGYSSCHWCHVMERESFLDEEIAALLNKHFVCIKVDREERPDIDSIYMTALQVFNQLSGGAKGGGWPLSMFLTPEAEPFLGGTYYPARTGDRPGLPGFLPLLEKVVEIWQKSPDRLREDAQTITRVTKRELEGRRLITLSPVGEKLVAGVQEAMAEQFDARQGGFGYSDENAQQPKFPESSNLVFLHDRVKRTKNEQAQTMLVTTLEKMSLGGIRDHLGGGFHRYSVDRFWRIPHFEKMLYDNGQLASAYAHGYELTGRQEFARTAREIAEFVLREMTDEQGGFYAAVDAESDGEEGKFYRWSREEVQGVLAGDEYQLFAAVYGLDGEPNFEEKFYVPQLARPLSEIAASRNLSEEELDARLQPIRQKLLAVRSKRVRPATDTKILAADNGLMIGGLADAGRLLKEPRYIQSAERAADFVLKNMTGEDGRLLRTYGNGEARLNAYVIDYAFLADGLLALYRATDNRRWLDEAERITKKQIELFHDEKVGDFFFTSDDHETLLARAKDPTDNAVPAGNSVTAGTLLFLAMERKQPEYLKLAEQTIHASAGLLETSPYAAPRMAANIPVWLEIKKQLGVK